MNIKDIIIRHYDNKEISNKENRKLSPIYHFKNFCNFVKFSLINRYINNGDRVLDLCAGKGSDIKKIMKRNIDEYVAVDISSNSINEAKRRFKHIYPRFKNAYFFTVDVFGEDFLDDEIFDVISCQFAFHYAFENKERLNKAFNNIYNHLKNNGYLIMTIPDSEVIKNRFNDGNKYYNIKYEGENKYHFWLIDSIDAPEFLADREIMIDFASRYDLVLIEENNFENIYSSSNKNILNKYKSEIKDKDQLELISLYKTMVFKKINTKFNIEY